MDSPACFNWKSSSETTVMIAPNASKTLTIAGLLSCASHHNHIAAHGSLRFHRWGNLADLFCICKKSPIRYCICNLGMGMMCGN